MSSVPFGNSKIISSSSVIYSYYVPGPGNSEMTMSRDVPVTHFHLRSSLPPACASHKSALSRPTVVNAPHRQACWSQGFVGGVNLNKRDPSIIKRRPSDRARALEDAAALKSAHQKEDSAAFFAQVKLKRPAFSSPGARDTHPPKRLSALKPQIK